MSKESSVQSSREASSKSFLNETIGLRSMETSNIDSKKRRRTFTLQWIFAVIFVTAIVVANFPKKQKVSVLLPVSLNRHWLVSHAETLDSDVMLLGASGRKNFGTITLSTSPQTENPQQLIQHWVNSLISETKGHGFAAQRYRIVSSDEDCGVRVIIYKDQTQFLVTMVLIGKENYSTQKHNKWNFKYRFFYSIDRLCSKSSPE